MARDRSGPEAFDNDTLQTVAPAHPPPSNRHPDRAYMTADLVTDSDLANALRALAMDAV